MVAAEGTIEDEKFAFSPSCMGISRKDSSSSPGPGVKSAENPTPAAAIAAGDGRLPWS